MKKVLTNIDLVIDKNYETDDILIFLPHGLLLDESTCILSISTSTQQIRIYADSRWLGISVFNKTNPVKHYEFRHKEFMNLLNEKYPKKMDTFLGLLKEEWKAILKEQTTLANEDIDNDIYTFLEVD